MKETGKKRLGPDHIYLLMTARAYWLPVIMFWRSGKMMLGGLFCEPCKSSYRLAKYMIPGSKQTKVKPIPSN